MPANVLIEKILPWSYSEKNQQRMLFLKIVLPILKCFMLILGLCKNASLLFAIIIQNRAIAFKKMLCVGRNDSDGISWLLQPVITSEIYHLQGVVLLRACD